MVHKTIRRILTYTGLAEEFFRETAKKHTNEIPRPIDSRAEVEEVRRRG